MNRLGLLAAQSVVERFQVKGIQNIALAYIGGEGTAYLPAEAKGRAPVVLHLVLAARQDHLKARHCLIHQAAQGIGHRDAWKRLHHHGDIPEFRFRPDAGAGIYRYSRSRCPLRKKD